MLLNNIARSIVRCATTLTLTAAVAVLVAFVPVPQSSADIFGPKIFERVSGSPQVFEQSFSLQGTVAPYSLVVVNGKSDGTKRLSNVSIKVNGIEVVKPNDLNNGVASLVRTLEVMNPQSEIRVKLAGTKKGYITVSVQGTDSSTPPLPPMLDPHPAATNAATLTITGVAAGAATVEVSGPSGVLVVPVAGGVFSAQTPLLPNHVHNLFFTAIGASGLRSAPTTTTVVQDSQPPSLFIDFPTDGAQLTLQTVDVAGRVGDTLSGFNGLSVSVNGIQAIVDIGVGPNGTFVAHSVPLAIGVPTVIAATATDSLGNVANAQIAVTSVQIAAGSPSMTAITGNGQQDAIHAQLATPLTVQILKGNGSPFDGKVVNFHVTRSDGRLSGGAPGGSVMYQAVTDATGTARAYWTLGSDAGCGNNRVEVTSAGVAGTVFFCASATPGPAAQINVGSGNNQRVDAGGPAIEKLSAWVSDACNGIGGVPVTFKVTQGGGLVNGLPSAVVQTDATGHAKASFVLGPTPGLNVVEADFVGNLSTPATFVCVGVARDVNLPTRLVGVVLDNASNPVQGAVCKLTIGGSVVGTEVTDIDGHFNFADTILAGLAHLHVDGLPATHIGGATGVDVPVGSYPALAYELLLIPNAENSGSPPA